MGDGIRNHGDASGVAGAFARSDRPPAQPAMSDLQRQAVGGAVTKLISASIGDICVVMSKSPAHKHFALADIEWKVLPAVLTGQFHVAEAMHTATGARAPLAVVTWARVSDETDARLRGGPGQPIRLRPDEWAAGPHHWLVDIAGEPRAIASAFEALLAGPFKDREVKILATDASGAPAVSTLGALLQSAGNTAGGAA